MHLLTAHLITAAEGPAHPNLWNPTILGVLVVISAIGLFCGSVYLLLSTNLGARLGFLVSFASLTGFMVLLSTLWWTSGNSGIDPPHGHSPTWKVVEVVSDPQQSKIVAVQNIAHTGVLADETVLANLRPAIDAALVTAPKIENQPPVVQPLAKFAASLDYLTDFKGYQTFTTGGGTKNVFWHYPKYAAVQFCPTLTPTPPGAAPSCDPLQDKSYAILGLQLRVVARAGDLPVLDPVRVVVRAVAPRPSLVRAGSAQAQARRPRTGAVDTRHVGRSHAARATTDRCKQGRRCRVPRVRDHGLPVRRIALLHGQGPASSRRLVARGRVTRRVRRE